MKYYLAGPMTGMPYHNVPLFLRVADDLRRAGYEIISPVELDDQEVQHFYLGDSTGLEEPEGEDVGKFLARDLDVVITEAEGLILLDGWEKSSGTCLEVSAALLYGKSLHRLMPPDKTVPVDRTYAATSVYKRLLEQA
jgi:hypothetical protein